MDRARIIPTLSRKRKSLPSSCFTEREPQCGRWSRNPTSRAERRSRLRHPRCLEQFGQFPSSFEKHRTIEIHSPMRQEEFIPYVSLMFRVLKADSRVLEDRSIVPLTLATRHIPRFTEMQYSEKLQLLTLGGRDFRASVMWSFSFWSFNVEALKVKFLKLLKVKRRTEQLFHDRIYSK